MWCGRPLPPLPKRRKIGKLFRNRRLQLHQKVALEAGEITGKEQNTIAAILQIKGCKGGRIYTSLGDTQMRLTHNAHRLVGTDICR